MFENLKSDAARPMKRTLHVQPLNVTDEDHLLFEFEVPSPGTFRHMTLTIEQAKVASVNGARKAKIVPVIIFEVDPDGPLVRRRYYLLPYGRTAEGAGVAEMMYLGLALGANGMPLAIYELPPNASEAKPASLVQ